MITGANLKKRMKKKKLLDEKGQALFEAMIFIPIFLYLVVMLINIGNSINVAINQNQATRAYTYFVMKGNSDGLGRSDLAALSGTFTEVGSFIIGWSQDYVNNTNPIASSFHIPTLPWAEAEDENCKDKSNAQDTNCIKVFTLYGVCGESFVNSGSGLFRTLDPTSGSMTPGCSYK